jgi:hypothetical protein
MTEQQIIKMETIGGEHEGQTVTVVGIPSHRTTDTKDAYGRVWLQDGVAVEALFDEEAWRRYESTLFSAAVLIRGRVEWYDAGRVKLARLHVEYAEARELIGIITESFS